jgi:hypothetical protein
MHEVVTCAEVRCRLSFGFMFKPDNGVDENFIRKTDFCFDLRRLSVWPSFEQGHLGYTSDPAGRDGHKLGKSSLQMNRDV